MDIKKICSFLQKEENRDFFSQLQRKGEFSLNEIRELCCDNQEKPIKDLLTLIRLQRRNLSKIPDAGNLIFTEKGVEQASSTRLATYHARKFSRFSIIADLCCGAGIDLIHLAEQKELVYAVDTDEDALLAAEFNSCRYKLKNILFRRQQAEDFRQVVEAVYIDPDRRPDNKRKIAGNDIQPALSEILKLIEVTRNIAVKLSPAMNYRSIKIDCEHTWEFISENGTLKEILLCLGKTATPGVHRKAVILPPEIVLTDQNHKAGTDRIGQFIFEPDAAIIRAGLVQECAAEIGYKLIDAKLALLTGNQQVHSELGKCYQVQKVTSFDLKTLQQYCRDMEIGDLVIKTRGFPETVENFRRKLKLKGKNKQTLFIIRHDNSHQFIFTAEEMKKNLLELSG